ncbi:MAG: methionine--tRNA ligase [Candidatus Hydrothermarchaeales archaeon]
MKKVVKIKEKVLVTCALPYVNNVPHIGNIAGSHLPSDIFARLCRLAGYETLFIGGSDEHGTPSEVTAEKLGVSPKELCDRYYVIHKQIYDWLDISYDNFSRTSLELHHKMTMDFFTKIYENGFISEGVLRLPYCKKCKRFLPDRYVEGTCPRCGYEEARGDQCEDCSTLLNPDELIEPRCIVCGSKPEIREVKHLFLNLDVLEPKLEEWIESNKGIWSGQVVKMALGWIDEGLKPRCITRDIKWGVKVPVKGYEDKVFYVWFDAPIGYISSTKEWASKIGKPEYWREFWQNPETKIIHFIGKDNIPFHTIFWPGILLARGEYNLPYRVAGLQYLNFEGGKISKSRGWGVFCENLPNAGLSSDVWRFYLTLLIPETNDTEWKWREFQERVNNELVANLGNFIYRTLSFIQNNFGGEVPEPELTATDKEVLEVGKRYGREVRDLIWEVHLRDALRKVLELSDRGNKYFQASEPWEAIKEKRKRAATTLYVCANLCYDLAILMSPFLPKSADKICGQLGVKLGTLRDVGKAEIKPGTKIIKPEPLFPKLDDETIENLREVTGKVTEYEEMFRPKISYEEFSKFDIKTAKILKVDRIKDADKLYKLQIDVGGKKKQLVAGIAQRYKVEELIGKTIVVIDNLKPAVIKGEKSEGMLLAAVSGDEVSLVTVDRGVESGSKVR